MSEVIFSYKGNQTRIQCDENEKMKNICIRFSIKLNIDINKLYFLYNGDKLNEGLKLIDIKKNNNINNIL